MCLQNLSHHLLKLFIVLIFAIYFNFGLSNADELNPKYASNPELIISQIKTRGASPVVEELYTNKSGWNYVLEQIATGNVKWLKVSACLREGTDAGTSSELGDAMNSALIKAPKDVLSTTIPPFEIWEICGRGVPLSTYKESIEDLENQIKAVQSVDDPQLVQKCNECIEHLEKSRLHLKRYFEIK